MDDSAMFEITESTFHKRRLPYEWVLLIQRTIDVETGWYEDRRNNEDIWLKRSCHHSIRLKTLLTSCFCSGFVESATGGFSGFDIVGVGVTEDSTTVVELALEVGVSGFGFVGGGTCGGRAGRRAPGSRWTW